MAQALRLARRGLGLTWPNPSVGSIVVTPTGEIVARGWTAPGGRPHAEAIALDRAGKRARGATIYITLEPCAHAGGRGLACADIIAATAPSRAVIALRDPDPRTSGRGLERLAAGGIEVKEGVLAQEAREVALGHILRVTEGRPAVTLKLAVGADGLMPKGKGAPVWITGPDARAHGHLLRARNDAILVGRGIQLLCHLSPWFVPMYGAGRLESGNIREYEDAARFAVGCGRADVLDCLLTMAEVEWDHERYFRGKIEGHPLTRVLGLWAAPPPKETIRTGYEPTAS